MLGTAGTGFRTAGPSTAVTGVGSTVIGIVTDPAKQQRSTNGARRLAPFFMRGAAVMPPPV